MAKREKRTKEETAAILKRAEERKFKTLHEFNYPFEDILDTPVKDLYTPKERGHKWINGSDKEYLAYLFENSVKEWTVDDSFSGWKDKKSDEELQEAILVESFVSQYTKSNSETCLVAIDWDEEVLNGININQYSVCSLNRLKEKGQYLYARQDYKTLIATVNEHYDGFHFKVFIPTNYNIEKSYLSGKLYATVMAEGICQTNEEAQTRASFYLENLQTLPESSFKDCNFRTNEHVVVKPEMLKIIKALDKSYIAHEKQAVANMRSEYFKRRANTKDKHSSSLDARRTAKENLSKTNLVSQGGALKGDVR